MNRHISGSLISNRYLERKKAKLAEGGWPVSKWITFCEKMIAAGFSVFVYEAKSTRSKYIYVVQEKRSFKLRFSNHRPRSDSELIGDCDFYVGVSNSRVTTTDDAIVAVNTYFATKELHHA